MQARAIPVVPVEEVLKEGVFRDLAAKREPFVVRGIDYGSCMSRTWGELEGWGSEVEVSVHVARQPKLDFLVKNFEYKCACRLLQLVTVSRMMGIKELVHRCAEAQGEEFLYMRALGVDPRKVWPAGCPHVTCFRNPPGWRTAGQSLQRSSGCPRFLRTSRCSQPSCASPAPGSRSGCTTMCGTPRVHFDDAA